MGTYNYGTPTVSPQHILYDVLPHEEWGTLPDYPNAGMVEIVEDIALLAYRADIENLLK